MKCLAPWSSFLLSFPLVETGMILKELTSWLFRIKFFTEFPKVIEILRQRKLIMIFHFFSKFTGDISFTGFTLLHINGFFTLEIGIQNVVSPKVISITFLS